MMRIGVQVALLVACSGLLTVMFLPPGSNKESTKKIVCLSYLKGLALSLSLYAEDHHDKFPPASDWRSLSKQYWKYGEIGRCPQVPEGSFGYAFSKSLGMAKLPAAPETTLLVFESTLLQENATGSFLTFPNPGRHYGRGNVAYADGHAKSMAPP